MDRMSHIERHWYHKNAICVCWAYWGNSITTFSPRTWILWSLGWLTMTLQLMRDMLDEFCLEYSIIWLPLHLKTLLNSARVLMGMVMWIQHFTEPLLISWFKVSNERFENFFPVIITTLKSGVHHISFTIGMASQ